jgi:hypothetical protein
MVEETELQEENHLTCHKLLANLTKAPPSCNAMKKCGNIKSGDITQGEQLSSILLS